MARGQFVPPSAWVMTLFVSWPRNLHNLMRRTFRRVFQTFFTGFSACGGDGNCVMMVMII